MQGPFYSSLNPLGGPWHTDRHGYVYGTNGVTIGTIRRGQFFTPKPIVAWMSGAAEVAHALYPLTLEGTYYVKDIARDIVALSDAIHAIMDAGQPILSEILEVRRQPPKWWVECTKFAEILRTKVVYDTPQSLMTEDWKHRLGYGQLSTQHNDSPTIEGVLYDFRMHEQDFSGSWDRTSLLLGAHSGQVLFQTDKIHAYNATCPHATPLFCKFLRRILRQGRSLNPWASPELLSSLTDAIFSVRPETEQIDGLLTYAFEADASHETLIKKAKKGVRNLNQSLKAGRQGTRVDTILDMKPHERSAYYETVRRHDLQMAHVPRQATFQFVP